MLKYLSVFCVLSLSSAAPAAVSEQCAPLSGDALPWAIDEHMSGDRYADVYLDIDAQGRPTDCKMGRTNILGDHKFLVCRAFLEQWSTQPPVNGQRTTVKREYVEYGIKHAEAERAARKKYFRKHPYERSECYPQTASTGRLVHDPWNSEPSNSR